MVSGWCAGKKKKRSRWFENMWWNVTLAVREAQVPYAIILGNHDDEGDLNRREILQLDIDTVGRGLSHTQQGPSSIGGASNYFLNIFPSNSSSKYASGPAARLWFFDSLNTGCAGIVGGWGCVPSSTVAWANQTATELRSSSPVSTSAAFVHIPIPEILLPLVNSKTTHAASVVVGEKGELSNCPSANTGLFAFAKEHGVGSIWSGHDHLNDYYIGHIDGGGVRIGYGRKTGYGSYVGVLPHGARVILFREGQQAQQTWLALENGQRYYQQGSLVKTEVQVECRSGGDVKRRCCGVAYYYSLAVVFILFWLVV